MRVVVPVAFALTGTFFFHRYTILTGLDSVQADTGDTRFVAAILEHWVNVFHGVARWREVPIFWPAKNTLAFSDALFGMGVVHAALRTGLDVFTAFNAQAVLLTLLTFAASYALLARGMMLSVWGASVGAAFAAFCWPRFAYLPHMQLQFTAPIPLILLLVLEGLRDGLMLSRVGFAWRMVLAAALGALLLATTLYYAIFTLLALTAALLLCMLHGASRSHLLAVLRRQWPGLAAAGVTAALLGAPTIMLYLPVWREGGGRNWPDVMRSMPRPRHFVWMGVENWMWGGLFQRWPQAEIEANWPELRIGVGLVASVAWGAGIVWAIVWAMFTGRRRLDTRTGLIVLFVLTGAVLQLSMVALPEGRSLWWLVWRFFPGASAIRAVSRLEIVVSFAMAVWFGTLVDRAIRQRRAWSTALAAVLVGVGAVEQFGYSHAFAGGRMAAFERGVAAQLAAPCPAVFVTGTADMRAPPILEESQFDAASYLAANPDIARGWTGTAWAHYQAFGRAEGRFLHAGEASSRRLLAALGYTFTLPLAAVLANKPVVNGYSGVEPPGWEASDMLGPGAADHLARWLARTHTQADAVCVVPIGISLDMIPFLPEALWP